MIFFYIDEDTEQLDSNYSDSDHSESNLNPAEHKNSLMKLQDTDPDFYKYMKENDKNLLDFGVSDDDDDNSSVDLDDGHISNENLEVCFL